MYGNVKSGQERDKQRRVACKFLNVTHLEVPYWWQHDKESVSAIIHEVRPDIVPFALDTPFKYNATRLNRSKGVNVISIKQEQ